MKSVLSLFLVLCVSLSAMAQAEDHGKDEKAAVKAAEKWLELVDSGSYPDSWENAADYFKGNMTKDGWDAALKGILPAMGKMQSRELVSSRYLKRMPGAPDGQYVMIRFKSSFENKAEAIETVTPQKGEDGKWRVCGYFIK